MIAPTAAQVPPSMTERELRFQEVLHLHAQGWNDSRIARALHLNRRTIKRYRMSRELPKRGAPMIQRGSSTESHQARWVWPCEVRRAPTTCAGDRMSLIHQK